MSFNIVSAKISGIPSISGWTQVHEFKPDEAEKLSRRGHFFAVISTKKKEEGVDSVTSGRELLSRLHEEYFGNLEVKAFVALKNAVGKVAAEFLQTWGDVEIAAVTIVEDVVYSAAVGGGKVSIYRDGAIATILESAGFETIAASGYPKEGDHIILGTKSFFEGISFGILKASLEGPDLSSSVESLAPIISGNSNSGNMGAVVVDFNKKSVLESVEQLIPKENSSQPEASIKVNPKNIFRNILETAAKIIPERKIFVKQRSLEDKAGLGKKATFWVGTIILLLLFVSIGFGIKQNMIKKHRATYQEELVQARNNLIESENLITSDSKRARELFLDSKTKVDNLLSRKIEDKELTALDKELKEKEAKILGIYKEEPGLYLDLSLLSSGFNGDKIIFSGANLYVFDKNGKKVVKIAIETKKTQIVSGPEQLDGVIDMFAYQDEVFGVFSDGIYRLGTKKEKVVEKDWQGDILAYAYTGNIYILDKSGNIVWRYAGSGGGFGSKQNWIAPGIKPDFKNAKQIVIDGTIWVLDEPFDVSRFSQGSPQAFNPQGVYPNIQSIVAIHTNEENKYIYLLDKNEGRLIVLEKNGIYKAQYQSDKFKEATGVIVSEKTSKTIILSKEKLIQIDLKHI